jgi:glycosyltransferase involved in cell wall biosynthesis
MNTGEKTQVSTVPILLVAPAAPPYGGMALQARLLEKLLRREGNAVVFFPSNFSLPEWLGPVARVPGLRTVLRSALIWPKLWREMRYAKVVHVLAASWLYFFAVVCPTVLMGRVQGKRVVLNYRGGGAERFFEWFGWVLAPFFKSASVVTAPSRFLADMIGMHFHVAVAIVPNILDLSRFQYRQRTVILPKLIVTRHLEKMYDLESVLRAFKVVQQNHPEASLWIAGTGSQNNSLRRLAVTMELKNVRFLGPVAHEDLPGIYDQCDIFVNASRVDNFPGALLEASAAGLSVVSTCAGGIPFIYEHEKSALLLEPGDWRGLAKGIERVLASPSLAIKLSAEGATLARGCDWNGIRIPLYTAYGMYPKQNSDTIASVV